MSDTVIAARKLPNGTLQVHAPNADQEKVYKLNSWLRSQMSDFNALEAEAEEKALESMRFGHLIDGGDSSDGMWFSALSGPLSHMVPGHHVRVSNPGEHMPDGRIENVEHVSQFRPLMARGYYGQLGLFRKLGRDPVVNEGKDGVCEGLTSGFWRWEGGDPELRRNLAGDVEPLITEQLIREFASAVFEDGCATWEILDALDGGVREIAPINANTIDRWITDPSMSVLQRVRFNDGRRHYEIPIEHLMLYSHHRTGANFGGVPQMRPCAGFVEMKQGFLQLTGLAGESHGLGIKIIEKTDPELAANAKEGARIVELFSAITAADNPVIELSAGRTFKWHSPTSTLPNFIPILEYLDQQIALPVSASGTLIGFQQTGSYALADVEDTKTLRTTTNAGHLFARLLQRNVVARIARNKYGVTRNVPTISYAAQREAKDPNRPARLVSYVGGGLLTWTREDEERLRAEEGLEPLPASAIPDPTGEQVDPRVRGAAAYNQAVHGTSGVEELEAAASSHDPVPDDLMSARDAAAVLNVPTVAITQLCRSGALRFWRIGAHTQVSLHDVMEYARQAANPEPVPLDSVPA